MLFLSPVHWKVAKQSTVLCKDAHEAFNSSRQIGKVLDKVVQLRNSGNPHGPLDIGRVTILEILHIAILNFKSWPKWPHLRYKCSLEPPKTISQLGEPLTMRVRDWHISEGLRLHRF